MVLSMPDHVHVPLQFRHVSAHIRFRDQQLGIGLRFDHGNDLRLTVRMVQEYEGSLVESPCREILEPLIVTEECPVLVFVSYDLCHQFGTGFRQGPGRRIVEARGP